LELILFLRYLADLVTSSPIYNQRKPLLPISTIEMHPNSITQNLTGVLA